MSVKRFLVVACCFLWGATASADVGKKLKEGLVATSPKVRIVAVAGVAKSKDPEARALLEGALKDTDAAVRAAVVDALGRMADPAAVPALEALKDEDPTVQKVLARVLPQLQALRVFVYVGKGEDYSKAGIDDIGQFLVEKTREAIARKLGPAFVIHSDPTKKSFGAAPLVVRSISMHKDGPNTFIDVKCELTLVDMPANILRAALASTASVGVEGAVSKRLEAELAHDGVSACAPELADDFVSYVKEHSRR